MSGFWRDSETVRAFLGGDAEQHCVCSAPGSRLLGVLDQAEQACGFFLLLLLTSPWITLSPWGPSPGPCACEAGALLLHWGCRARDPPLGCRGPQCRYRGEWAQGSAGSVNEVPMGRLVTGGVRGHAPQGFHVAVWSRFRMLITLLQAASRLGVTDACAGRPSDRPVLS